MPENEMTLTEAARVRQERLKLTYALEKTLRRLRKFMAVYPRNPIEQMPEHDCVWEDGPCDGPGSIILDAIKTNPSLWLGALPDDVCIVPKADLERLTIMAKITPQYVEHLADLGIRKVTDKAARLLHAREE
jgi:hypothetical protein